MDDGGSRGDRKTSSPGGPLRSLFQVGPSRVQGHALTTADTDKNTSWESSQPPWRTRKLVATEVRWQAGTYSLSGWSSAASWFHGPDMLETALNIGYMACHISSRAVNAADVSPDSIAA